MFTTFLWISFPYLIFVSAYNIKDRNYPQNLEYESHELMEYSFENKDAYNYDDYRLEPKEYSSEEDTYDSMENWRQTLREKLKKNQMENSKELKFSGRRFFVPAPLPPTPPDVDDLNNLRSRLEGKRLEDTSFVFSSDGVNFAETVLAENNLIRKSAMEDLHKVICIMDCHLANRLLVSGFRGKDGRVSEKVLEEQWKNMTEIEQQLLKVVSAKNNSTRQRRSISVSASGILFSVFQNFAEWCTNNCQNPSMTTSKPVQALVTETLATEASVTEALATEASKTETLATEASITETLAIEALVNEGSLAKGSVTEDPLIEANHNLSEDNIEDYASEESLENAERRAIIDNKGNFENPEGFSQFINPKHIPYEVQVPVTHLIKELFGEKHIESLTEIRLCVCGRNKIEVCYCQSNNKTDSPLKLIPSL